MCVTKRRRDLWLEIDRYEPLGWLLFHKLQLGALAILLLQWSYGAVDVLLLPYLEGYQRTPEFYDMDGDEPLRAPWFYIVAVSAVIGLKGGISLSEGWNMALSLAVCVAATVGSLHGSKRLITPQEQAAMDKLKDAPGPRPRVPPGGEKPPPKRGRSKKPAKRKNKPKRKKGKK